MGMLTLTKEFTELAKFYRYLKVRHCMAPLFLYRNLSYMKKQGLTHENNNKRKNFKIDNLLDQNTGKFLFERFKDTTSRMEEDNWPKYMLRLIIDENVRKDAQIGTNVECPWCWINCKTFDVLCQHIKLCHFGFNIDIEKPQQSLPIITVSIARPYLLLKSLKSKEKLYKRAYYNTKTNQPMSRREIEEPSVLDLQPPWQLEKACRNIDEFSDLNNGEKELMKLWNEFMGKSNFVGDCQIPKAIEIFIESYGIMIMERKLYKNFVLHLINLNDFHVITPKNVFEATNKIQQIIIENDLGHCLISREIMDDLVLNSDSESDIDSGIGIKSLSQDDVIFID